MKPIEIDRTDEEREELVKQWIKDYWLMIVLAVLMAIGAVYGLNYFKQSKINALSDMAEKTQAVNQYLLNNQLPAAEQQVAELQEQQADTSFSALATLSLAQRYFNDKAYDKALAQYGWLIAHSDDIAMRDLARLRKARVQAEQQQFSAAITTLNGMESQNNIDESNLLKGDILLADQQLDAAKQAYQAISDNPQINAQVVQQRLELVNIKQQKQSAR